jgi:hypothetical protein
MEKNTGKNVEIIQCPHCNEPVIIEELNCMIFRHGIFKNTGQQIDPHSTIDQCFYYAANNLIYGCGKPFKINIVNGKYVAEICGYI